MYNQYHQHQLDVIATVHQTEEYRTNLTYLVVICLNHLIQTPMKASSINDVRLQNFLLKQNWPHSPMQATMSLMTAPVPIIIGASPP